MSARSLPFYACLCLFLSCHAYRSGDLPAERIHFATGGGFSGQVQEYVLLLKNGTVLTSGAGPQAEGEMTRLGKIGRPELASIESSLAEMDLSAMAAGNTSGNMTNTLTYYSGGKQETLRWSASGPAPSAEVGTLYSKLMQQVKKLREGA